MMMSSETVIHYRSGILMYTYNHGKCLETLENPWENVWKLLLYRLIGSQWETADYWEIL